MSFTYDPILRLALPSDDDQDHGDELRQNFGVIARIGAPENVYFVSPSFTDALLHNASASDRRHFATIQGAIDAFESAHDDESYGAIMVYPGRYNENLSVAKSLALVATHHQYLEQGGGSRGVYLRGNGTVAPLVTFNPSAGDTRSLFICGFNMTNAAAAQGAQLDECVLDTVDVGSGNYGPYINPVTFQDCNFRLGGGNNNGWNHGFRVRANHWCIMHRCRLLFASDLVGMNYHRFGWYVDGNASTGKLARLTLSETEVTHWNFTGTSNATVYCGSDGYGLVKKTAFSRAFNSDLVVDSGSNLIGLRSAEEAGDYLNPLGISMTEF